MIHLAREDQKDQAIARTLGISYNTFRTELYRLREKVGAKGRIGILPRILEAWLRGQQIQHGGSGRANL